MEAQAIDGDEPEDYELSEPPDELDFSFNYIAAPLLQTEKDASDYAYRMYRFAFVIQMCAKAGMRGELLGELIEDLSGGFFALNRFLAYGPVTAMRDARLGPSPRALAQLVVEFNRAGVDGEVSQDLFDLVQWSMERIDASAKEIA